MKLHMYGTANRQSTCGRRVRYESHLLGTNVFVLLSHHLVRPSAILCKTCRDKYNTWQQRPEYKLTWK